jgi:hypothetical protein
MSKRKGTKKKLNAARRNVSALARKARDDAYRRALGVAPNAKLPTNIGNTASAGGRRDRRGRVTGGIGESTKGKDRLKRGRARLLG